MYESESTSAKIARRLLSEVPVSPASFLQDAAADFYETNGTLMANAWPFRCTASRDSSDDAAAPRSAAKAAHFQWNYIHNVDITS